MNWPEDVDQKARDVVDTYFRGTEFGAETDMIKLAFAYGYIHAHDLIRRESILGDFMACVRNLDNKLEEAEREYRD